MHSLQKLRYYFIVKSTYIRDGRFQNRFFSKDWIGTL